MSDYLGIYKGSVLNNNDPEKRGRVILNIPQVLGGQPSAWCEPIYTTVYTPKINEVCWVHFVNGDLTKPIYLSSEAVTAEKIAAGSITADKLAAQLLLASDLHVGDNITIDPTNGIYITLPSTDPVNDPHYIHFPTDGTEAKLKGVSMEVLDLLVDDNMQVSGDNNHIAGLITLSSSVKPPSTAPTVSAVYDQSPLTLGVAAAYAGLGDNGTYWQSAAVTSYSNTTGTLGLGIFAFDKTTGARPASYGVNPNFYYYVPNSGGAHPTSGGPTPTPSLLSFHSNPTYSVTAFYLPAYTTGYYNDAPAGWVYSTQPAQYRIVVTNNVTGALISNWTWSTDMNWKHPAVFTDGTYIYVAGSYADGSLRLYRYSSTGTGGIQVWNSGASVYGPIDLTSLWIGDCDLPSVGGSTQRVIVNWSGGTGVFSSTGARRTSEEWSVPEYCRGLAWTGTRFVMQGGSSKIWKLSTNKTAVNRTAAYTWYNPTTGAESTASATSASTSHGARQWLSVTTPVIPSISDPAGPTAARIYVDTWRQADLASRVITALYETPATGTATAPVVDGFSALNFNSGLISQELRLDGNPKVNIKSTGASNLDGLIAPGTITMFGGPAAPSGWIHCDGSSHLVADFPDLFAAIGYAYGGSGANFNVPNLLGRFPTHATPGSYGGANSRAIPASALPVHQHSVGLQYATTTTTTGSGYRLTDMSGTGGLGGGSAATGLTNNAGSGAAMDMTPAYTGVIFMIKT